MPAEPRGTRPGGWSNRDFYDEVAAPRRLWERGITTSLVAVATFFVFLFAAQHEAANCEDACYGGPLRTYEPGHAWTAYDGSWQWQAQWGMGLIAFLLGLAALATVSRYRLRAWTVRLSVVALVVAAGWIAWRFLEPPIPT
jgi:hypothetical protein